MASFITDYIKTMDDTAFIQYLCNRLSGCLGGGGGSGVSGFSGYSGFSGVGFSGFSGYSGQDGTGTGGGFADIFMLMGG